MSLTPDKYGLLYRPNRLATVRNGRVNLNKLKMPPIGQTQQMHRIGFRRDVIRPRGMVGNVDEIQALDEKMHGKKIQLSEKTIRDMFEVQVPDPNDTKWRKEGRLQRTKGKVVNFGSISKNLNTQLATIATALAQGRTESETDRAKMLAQLTSILGSTSKLNKLTEDQFASLGKVVDALNIPKEWFRAGFPRQLWSWDQFSKGGQTGMILAYLMANSSWGKETPVQIWYRKRSAPLKTKNLDDGVFKVGNLGDLFAVMRAGAGKAEKYLDLETQSVIPEWEAENMVIRGGVDAGMLNGKALLPPPFVEGTPTGDFDVDEKDDETITE